MLRLGLANVPVTCEGIEGDCDKVERANDKGRGGRSQPKASAPSDRLSHFLGLMCPFYVICKAQTPLIVAVSIVTGQS